MSKIIQIFDRQTKAPSELIVIDTGSSDGTLECLWREYKKKNRDYTLITHIYNGAFPGTARNKGVEVSKSNWNIFLDAGIVPDDDWLEKLWSSRNNGGLGIVFGQCDFRSNSLIGKALLSVSYGLNKSSVTIPGVIFQKKVFFAIGCFREDLRAAEDLEWKSRVRAYFGVDSLPVCKTSVLHYVDAPDNFLNAFYKWKRNSIYTVYSGQRKLQVLVYTSLWFVISVVGYTLGLGYIILFAFFYMILRGVVDPIRRCGDPMWWNKDFRLPFLAILAALSIDLAKTYGFLVGLFDVLVNRKRLDQ